MKLPLTTMILVEMYFFCKCSIYFMTKTLNVGLPELIHGLKWHHWYRQKLTHCPCNIINISSFGIYNCSAANSSTTFSKQKGWLQGSTVCSPGSSGVYLSCSDSVFKWGSYLNFAYRNEIIWLDLPSCDSHSEYAHVFCSSLYSHSLQFFAISIAHGPDNKQVLVIEN